MEQQSQKLQQMTANWSNLPEEAIKRIAFELHWYGIEYRSFRAVCRNWRKLSPSFNHFFHVIFPNKIPTKSVFARPITLISTVSFLLVSNGDYSEPNDQSMLLTIDEYDKGKLKLLHPITNELLDINHGDFPKRLNLFGCDAIAVDVGVKSLVEESDEDEVCSRYYDSHSKSVFFWPDFVAVLSFNEKGGLGLLKMVDGELKFPELDAAYRCDDITNFKDLLFVLSHSGDVFVIGGSLCKPCDEVDGGNGRKRLAVCYEGGEVEELYLIVRNACEFRVYKLSGREFIVSETRYCLWLIISASLLMLITFWGSRGIA